MSAYQEVEFYYKREIVNGSDNGIMSIHRRLRKFTDNYLIMVQQVLFVKNFFLVQCY